MFASDGRSLISDEDMKVNSWLYIKSYKQRMKELKLGQFENHELGLEFY